VGIGTSSPVDKVSLYSATSVYQRFQNSTTGTGAADGFQIGNDATNAYVWNYEASSLVFATSGTERARITPAGDVLIGTTASGPGSGNTTVGIELAADGQMFVSSAATPAFFNRNVDGTVVCFSSAGTAEGTISISGTTT
jgi:hypothetical protein